MRVSAREDHRTFRTDIERMTDGHLRSTSLDVLRSTNTQAVFRGAVAKGPHTATGASLAEYLQARLASENIHLDLTVSIDQ